MIRLQLRPKLLILAGLTAAIAGGAFLGQRWGGSSQASALDTAYARDTAQYRADTLATDTTLLKFLPDSFKPSAPVKAAVKAERSSATRAIRTAEARTKQARTELRAANPRLAVFLGPTLQVSFPDPGQLPTAALVAEIGAQLRLGAHLSAEAAYQQPLLGRGRQAVRLALRQHFRLF